MLNENIFLKKAFTSGQLFTGFIEDPPDKRDYKFSDLMKSQGKMKTVKKRVKKLVSKNRGCYRKAGYGKTIKGVTVKEDIIIPLIDNSSLLEIDHSVNLSPIKDQKSRPTCVSFAGAAMKEFQEKTEHEREIKEGKRGESGKVYDYSEQWLYQNCKKIDGIENEGGTYIRAVMKVMHKIGVPTEKAWLYTDDGIDIGKPKFWSEMIARWAIIGSYWSCANLNELKVALIDAPVVIGVPVFLEWANPSKGIINYPSNPGKIYGGHAILACGFNNEKQMIKIKNSWGDSWGDKGYGYLPYRYIDDFLWSAWAARDISVTKDMLKGKGNDLTPLEW